MEQISKELGGVGELVFKTLCFIKHFFFLLDIVSPTCDSNTLALLLNCGQLHQEEVRVTLLVAAVMTSVGRRKNTLKKQSKCNRSGFGQCKRISFRQLIGILPREEHAVMADKAFQRFLV